MSLSPRAARGRDRARRGLRALLWIGLAVGPAAAPTPVARAQETPPAAADAPALNSVVDRAYARWLRRKAFVARGDRAGAAVVARELLDFLEDESVARVPSLAEAAILEGGREENSGGLSAAIESYQLARTLDPHQTAAYWGEARARLKAGEGVGAGARSAFAGATAYWSAFWRVYDNFVQFAALGFLALLAAGAAAIVALLAAHGPRLVHELVERLPREWHPSWRRSVGWALVLAPAAIQWLGAFALLPWGVALAPAAKPGERRLIYGWLVLVAAAAPLAGVAAALASVSASPAARAAVAAAEGALQPGLAAELTRLSDSQPRESLWLALLARVVASRRPDEGVRLLRQAVALAPGDPRLRVALGNVFYRSGKQETAAVHYRDALRADPTDALALFNLHRVRTALLDVSEADELLTRARAAAPERVRALEASTGDDGVGDPVFPVPEVARRILAVEAAPQIRNALVAGPLAFAALAALLAAFVLRLRVGEYASRRCSTCGDAFCTRCTREDEDPDVCHPCHQLFTRREGLAPAARQEQIRRIDRRARRVLAGRVLTQAVWPGLALIHDGRTGLGFAEAALWAYFVLGVLAPGTLIPVGATLSVWPLGTIHLVVGALFWVLAQTPWLRPASAEQRGGR